MSDIERLASLRCDKATGNVEVKPIDILRAAAHDIETGKVKADSIVILFGHCPDALDQPWVLETYRAGCPRDREIVLLNMQLAKTIRTWGDG
jgi:hypothetical protein